MTIGETAGESRRPGPTAAFRIAWIVIALLSLWLRMGFPVHAIADAGADDALFVRLARSLQAGDWLGPYDNLTLAKGMFYPLFIAATSFLAIPLRAAEHLTYLGAAALAAGFLQRRTGRRWLSLLVFAALAFNPALWSPALARVIRENLYVSLSLLLVVLTVVAAFPARACGLWRRLGLGIALGLVAAGYWLTREEGAWLLPSLAAIVLTALAGIAWGGRGGGPPRRIRFGAMAVPLLAGLLVFTAGIGTVAALNAAYYGVFETSEFKSTAFQRGYGALARIRPAHWRRLVVFPHDARARLYAVSPAARELAPFFDGAGGEGWRRVGCTQSLMPSVEACPEILGGWFMWALRDAATAAGHGTSAVAARDFYTRLADEIDAACAGGRLDCLPPRTTLAPPFRWQYLRDAVAPAALLLRRVFTMRDGPVGSAPSTGPRSAIHIFMDAIGMVFPPDAAQRRLQGWVGATAGPPDILLRGLHGEYATSTILRWPGDYIRGTFPDMHGLGFALETTCPPEACEIVVTVENGASVAVPWADARQGMVFDSSTVRIFGDSMTTVRLDEMSARRRAVQVGIAEAMGHGYALVFPLLGVLGAAGLLLALLRHRSRPIPLPLLALMLASGGAVAARVALLAYLDVTSIPSANLLYVSPAAPFAMVFAILGLWLGLRALNQAGPAR